jgi:hypothetical protein
MEVIYDNNEITLMVDMVDCRRRVEIETSLAKESEVGILAITWRDGHGLVFEDDKKTLFWCKFSKNSLKKIKIFLCVCELSQRNIGKVMHHNTVRAIRLYIDKYQELANVELELMEQAVTDGVMKEAYYIQRANGLAHELNIVKKIVVA